MNPIIVCADIGSVAKGRFGWWSFDGAEGDSPSELAKHVSMLLNQNKPVALGFECPLFVPVRKDERELTKGRNGEKDRSWSAGAGCGALATGLVQTDWILREIRTILNQPSLAFLEWEPFIARGEGLFIWEAFVSGNSKSQEKSHRGDAKLAAQAFERALPNPMKANVLSCDSEVHSLVGASLLRTRWSLDISLLSAPCLVIKA